MVSETNELLSLTKDIAASAYQRLVKVHSVDISQLSYSQEVPREMKSFADKIMEETIIERLLSTGISVLSEESGEFSSCSKSSKRFVVDPLDGTVNFVRDLGPCSISIALCDNDQPIFGVLAIYPSGDLAWGGKGMGAFLNDRPLHVSKITDPSKAILCTGFPSRYRFDDQNVVAKHVSLMSHFGKVRMLGAASNSMLNVAKGSAEMYSEQNIMLWDIVAGLALVEGSGGVYSMKSTDNKWCYNVEASNGKLDTQGFL